MTIRSVLAVTLTGVLCVAGVSVGAEPHRPDGRERSEAGTPGRPGSSRTDGQTGTDGSSGSGGRVRTSGPAGRRGAGRAAGAQGPAGAAGTARAYAFVPASGTLDPVRSKGFLRVEHPGAGTYCLIPSPSADVDLNAATWVATIHGAPVNANSARFAFAIACAGGLGVATENATTRVDAAFAVIVP